MSLRWKNIQRLLFEVAKYNTRKNFIASAFPVTLKLCYFEYNLIISKPLFDFLQNDKKVYNSFEKVGDHHGYFNF